jgi:phosphatidylglycerol:prolipoprotein diacylglycerol transferase
MPALPIAAIGLPFDPNITGGSGFALSWHGFLSFVAVAVAVWLVARAARTERGVDVDMVYNTAIWAIVGGILGARLVHVADNWDKYGNDLLSIFSVWEGGIGLWGGILGGWLGGITYAHFVKYPVGKLMDMTAAPLLLSQTIGRIGDIINGEHWSRESGLPWAWYFTDSTSPARIGANNEYQDPEQPVHPAVVYEMIWNIIGLFILYKLRHRLKPDGGLFMVYLAYYSVGRFMVQFIRLDKVYFASLQEAHLIAIGVLAVSVPFLAWKVRFKKPGETESGPAGDNEPPATGRRREERRRRRARAKAT